MAREVISKSINSKPSSNTTNPLQEELDNECEDDGVDYSEEASLAFMKTLKGESLARFLNIMKSLTERDYLETLLIEENVDEKTSKITLCPADTSQTYIFSQALLLLF